MRDYKEMSRDSDLKHLPNGLPLMLEQCYFQLEDFY